ncbi:MAG: radical SAM family heme chaperone HemW [Gammaproteobacteria bacterium]|uniref:Heme chaperone HemW n=1 Tax=Candidatus Thiopontia autotrophica TaxID=2841688 RepID=A0A8J6P337_9GAMM|nr:radical SAM family heme chaperone HemW [Candidatus Thiopontia autotrophica]MBL6969254.1 radical SAM family heme chaperone HemW [Gammaproteobacteria bacterium]
MTELNFTAVIPLSLYIHLPWCLQKCPYCDFNSHASGDALPFDHYVDALLLDLEWELPRVWGRPVRSIFIGGGTPSLFPAEEIERLLSGIRARLPFGPEPEVTLEANPGAVEQERFAGYRQAGVNRLSIGVQSFDDGRLEAIGRIHDGEDAATAVEMARGAGFENINLDLMFGLPQQSRAEAMGDLQQAVALGVEHLSWYQLTMEPNTPFGHQPPPLPDDEELWEMQLEGQQLLQEEGLEQYEISAYAREQSECRHNLNYWRFGDYLGIGAGAHSKITMAADGAIIRSSRQKSPQRYMDGAGSERLLSERHTVPAHDLPLEFMMNRLRINEPFTVRQFEERTGCSWNRVESTVEKGCREGLLLRTGEQVVATDHGREFLNDLLALFMNIKQDGE